MKLLVTAMMIVFCCSITEAQFSYSNAFYGGTLIYSNAFSGGAVDISGTAPTYINPNAATYGGSLGATFYVVTNNVATGSYAYQNGTLGAHLNSVLLPLTLTNGYVYNFSATLTFLITPPAGGWGGIGYATSLPVGKGVADARISALGGNPWTLLNMLANGGGAIFEINGASHGQVPSLMNALNTPYVINLLVDTTTTNWTAAEYVAGTLINTFTYTGHPSLISFGYTQTTTTAGAFQWGPIAISAVPLVITKEPVSTSVNAGSFYTNTVIAGGQSPFFYQWYTNGVAIGNATNASLILNPVSGDEASTNYTVIVTNVYGAVTSTPANLVVYTAPQFLSANPITYTNPMTLFGGSGGYLGSSPSFSINAGGALPLSYFWLTNGVAVGGANSTNFTFTNCQMGGPTSFSCIVSNGVNTATNTWTAQYIPTPTAPYPQLILTDAPAAYWRLDETNFDQTLNENDGEVCNDFMSGNNGIYTNAALAQTPGYFVVSNGVDVVTDPNETATYFGPPLPVPGGAFSVGTNVDFSTFTNAEFTVSVWANGGYLGDSYTEPVNGGLVAKGGFGTEEFALDDGGSGGDVRFMVRNAAATLSGASSIRNLSGDDNWHLLVGVCDESNGVVNLYIDGLLTAQTTIPKGSGVLPSALAPITIGFDGGGQFNGGLDDVAIFPYALNANQVNALYQSAGGVNPLTFTAPVPPTNVVWRVNQTLTIPASALGAPPLGYYWTNVTTGGIVSGTGVHGAT
ncbi:MAG TPA: LamG-like jellyroll fold domain-containing protein, partial [Verrucomicrobiae bacterium]